MPTRMQTKATPTRMQTRAMPTKVMIKATPTRARAMLAARRYVRTATTPIIRMPARLMASTVRSGLSAEHLSGSGPGITGAGVMVDTMVVRGTTGTATSAVTDAAMLGAMVAAMPVATPAAVTDADTPVATPAGMPDALTPAAVQFGAAQFAAEAASTVVADPTAAGTDNGLYA